MTTNLDDVTDLKEWTDKGMSVVEAIDSLIFDRWGLTDPDVEDK